MLGTQVENAISEFSEQVVSQILRARAARRQDKKCQFLPHPSEVQVNLALVFIAGAMLIFLRKRRGSGAAEGRRTTGRSINDIADGS